MESGKAQVLGAIMKLDRPFNAAAITEMTGLDRQLVRYHLIRFTEQGTIEKIGKTYTILNKAALVDSFLESNTSSDIRKVQSKGFFNTETANFLSELATGVVYLKVLRAPLAIDMAVHLNVLIDETIAELKAMKRFVNNSQPGIRAAAKFYQQYGGDKQGQMYDAMVGRNFKPALHKEEWTDQLDNISSEALSDD